MTLFWQSVLKRFLRAFVAGAAGSMILVHPMGADLKSLQTWLAALAVAGIFGGITGLLLALDKAYRYDDSTPQV